MDGLNMFVVVGRVTKPVMDGCIINGEEHKAVEIEIEEEDGKDGIQNLFLLQVHPGQKPILDAIRVGRLIGVKGKLAAGSYTNVGNVATKMTLLVANTITFIE